MRRLTWMAVGAVAGAVATRKAGRLIDLFTPGGVRDAMAGVGAGLLAMREEVVAGTRVRRAELDAALAQVPVRTTAPRELPAGEAAPSPSTSEHGRSPR